MFGIGMPEAILIGVVALIVVGPKKLPELARTLGKGLSEFRRTASDVADEFKETIQTDEIKEDAESIKPVAPGDGNEKSTEDTAPPVPPEARPADSSPPATKGDAPEA
ncbi:MAG: Sec-independent protein translocase protein TatB [Syntrophales bacterium]